MSTVRVLAAEHRIPRWVCLRCVPVPIPNDASAISIFEHLVVLSMVLYLHTELELAGDTFAKHQRS